jgi:predicted AlkP superfamily phosphohydrolase/phosphomutase
MTGRNPGKHNIYGFVDRDPKSLEMYIPTSRNMKSRTLWEDLGLRDKRVLVINVPLTYPPRPVNGILIGCFLCVNIDRVAYPLEVSKTLKAMGYRIDADAKLARGKEGAFLEDLHETLRKRVEAGLHFYGKEPWDFFHLHIMETDRINHFLWDGWADESSPRREAFLGFYREVDRAVGEVVEKIDPGSELVLLSDHGFCAVKREVNLNAWLKEKGWLRFQNGASPDLKALHPESKAYSLLPGRIYLPGEAARKKDVEREILSALADLRDPAGGDVIRKVWKRDDLYRGPHADNGPDLVAAPVPGYDLKGNLSGREVFSAGETTGMHTEDDAFLYIRNRSFNRETAEIIDLYPTILSLLKLPPEGDLDGSSIAA